MNKYRTWTMTQTGYDKRMMALKMRREGKLLREIAEVLGVALPNVSHYVREAQMIENGTMKAIIRNYGA